MVIATETPVISVLKRRELSPTQIAIVLLVAGTGFLIDVYDIAIFSVVRIPSLKSLGMSAEQIFPTGVFLLNLQLTGMVLGAFLWGVIGDKKGRKSALFGSICLYSLATFANGFVTSVPAYALLRFLAGIGLAGEVGAAITIASEVTPAKYRTYATGAVRGMGLIGALLASLAGDRLPWRMAYIIAGLLGILLLFVRMSIKETAIFANIVHDQSIELGSLRLLLFDKKRLLRLTRCILAAVPYWFVVGVITAFAPEICSGAGSGGVIVTVAAVVFADSIGRVPGEIAGSILSQILRNRKLAMLICLTGCAVLCTTILRSSPKLYVWLCMPLGLTMGYFTVILTSTAEQFGTNLRSSATSIVANFVRASAIPITLLFSALATNFGMVHSAMIVGGLCFTAAFISIVFMDETFAKDLNFVER